MKLRLFWEESVDGLFPSCSAAVVNKDGVSPLACLLTDDGGQRFLDTLSWLDEGIARIKLIKDSRIDFANWSREAWGSDLSKEEAKIYSLYDENCFENLSLNSFETALVAWKSFIQLTPKAGMNRVIEI